MDWLSDLVKKKSKKSPVSNLDSAPKNHGVGSSTAAALRPDQLYSTSSIHDSNWNLDCPDNAISVNGTLISPVGSEAKKTFLKTEPPLFKEKRENFMKETDLSSYGTGNSLSEYKSSEKLNLKSNDPFSSKLNNLVDTNGSKYKSPSRSVKVNNGDTESILPDLDWVGNKPQSWTGRDFDSTSSQSATDRHGRTNNGKDLGVRSHHILCGMYGHLKFECL